jgi:hypothetical protein
MAKTKTIAQLRAEIRRKEKTLASLQKKREKVLGDLDKIDNQIAAIQGEAPPAPAARTSPKSKTTGRRRRTSRKLPKNTKPLTDYIRDVLAENPKGMRVMDIEQAVQKKGYKTNSDNFYTIVAAALRDKSFEKIDRGVYKLKDSASKSHQPGKTTRKTSRSRKSAGKKRRKTRKKKAVPQTHSKSDK